MNRTAGLPLLIAAAGLIVLGIAWGAATQHETFQGQAEGERLEAAGNLVPATALLSGLGVALLATALGSAHWLRRLGGASLAGASAWILVILLQGDFPNFSTVEGSGQAILGQSTLLVDGTGSPSVLLPVVVAGGVLLAGVMVGVRRAFGGNPEAQSPIQAWRSVLATAALGVPFLVVVLIGSVRVMLALDAAEPGTGLALALLPLSALSATAWLVLIFLRVWHGRGVIEEPRLVPAARETWTILRRAEYAVAGVLLATAVLSTALPATETPATMVGRTLIFTLRSHGQGLAFAALALLPLMRASARFGHLLSEDWGGPAPATREAVAFTVAAGVAVLAGLATGFTTQALLPWMVTFLPVAIYAGIHAPAAWAGPTLLMSAWMFWARGNTFAAFFDETRFPAIAFGTHPGWLSLWRLVGVALLAWAVQRHAASWGGQERRSIVVTLALVAAAGVALLTLVEVPLWVWDEGRVPVKKLAIGSLLRSQVYGVQVVSHILAAVSGVGAALAGARLLRPEWFRRTPRAQDAPASVPASMATR